MLACLAGWLPARLLPLISLPVPIGATAAQYPPEGFRERAWRMSEIEARMVGGRKCSDGFWVDGWLSGWLAGKLAGCLAAWLGGWAVGPGLGEKLAGRQPACLRATVFHVFRSQRPWMPSSLPMPPENTSAREGE